MARYYVYISDEVQGPYEAHKIVDLPGFSADLSVCREGTNEWIPASIFTELAKLTPIKKRPMTRFDRLTMLSQITSIVTIVLVIIVIWDSRTTPPIMMSSQQTTNAETPDTEITQASPPPVMTLALFDDFNDGKLDSSLWRIAKRIWGGENHGVVPDNVSEADGYLILEAHGNNYKGVVGGLNRYGVPILNGTRAGAAIATRNSFASGRYEVRAKIAPDIGVCSAFWSFYNRELYPGDPEYGRHATNNRVPYIINHEIDMEFPGRPEPEAFDSVSLQYGMFNNWRGNGLGECRFSFKKLPFLHDGRDFHTYRFDWFTGDKTRSDTSRVDFYIDDNLIHSSFGAVPTIAGQFWLGLWFPSKWAGPSTFSTTRMYVDWVRISTFNQPDDEMPDTSIPVLGWAEDHEYNINKLGNQRRGQYQAKVPPLLIANFDTHTSPPKNLQGGRYNYLQSLPSTAEITVALADTATRPDTSLQLTYNQESGSWCGLWMRFAPDGAFLNAAAYRELSFSIKGEQGGEDCDVGLSDQKLFQRDDSTPAGNIADFLPNGITRSWQKVTIVISPLLRLDKTALNGFVITGRGHGTIYIDNVMLENKRSR